MPFTFNGFGTKFYGEADYRKDGSFITTQWITAAYIPLIPLRSYRLVRSGKPFDLMSATFGVLEELPILWPQVLRVYFFFLGTGCWFAAIIWFFFYKLTLNDLYQSHRIAATLLVSTFTAALAVPFVMVWLLRKISMSVVGIKPPEFGEQNGKKLRPGQKVLAIVGAAICVLPALIISELKLPPAAWLNKKQAEVFVSFYYPQLTFVLLMFANVAVVLFVLFVLSAITQLLTGKKLFELFRNERAEEPVVAEPLPTTPPPKPREDKPVTRCHMCNYQVDSEQQRTLKTCPSCGADLTRQRR